MSEIVKITEIETPKWVTKLQYPMILALIAYLILNWKNVLLDFDFSRELLFSGLVVFCLYISLTLIHEYCHYFAARLFRYKAKVYLKEKLCIIYGNIKPVHFLLIAIAPAIFQSLIIGFLIYYLSNGLIFIASLTLLYMTSITSDVYLAIKSLRYLKNESVFFKYIGDTVRKGYFAIYKYKD